MKRVLFVCLGNICRSPAAEAIMKAKLRQLGKGNEFVVDSAGTYGGHAGALPDERMRERASRRGYVVDSRSRAFYPSADFPGFDLIIGMDNQNVADLKRLALHADERNKIVRMMDFFPGETPYREVPDPYYEGTDGFELVLDLLEKAIDGLLEHLGIK
ncbi:MAG: low molecular weight phosphotyrosine protein phosphatase [Oscillibacter sp.]|nr:low molecular weight phosphotyrosine protein phosphatase [Oscillibacter sp.]